MNPLQFMQRLAALVPRPRLHLTKRHGMPAPNAGLQAPLEQRKPATEAAASPEFEVETVLARPHRISLAQLLTRVFDIDMQHRPEWLVSRRRPLCPS